MKHNDCFNLFEVASQTSIPNDLLHVCILLRFSLGVRMHEYYVVCVHELITIIYELLISF